VNTFFWTASLFAALSVAAIGRLPDHKNAQTPIERQAEAATSETKSDARDQADAWLNERVETLRSKTDRTQQEQELLEEFEGRLPQTSGTKLAPL